MGPLKRLNFVLRQDTHRLDAGDEELGTEFGGGAPAAEAAAPMPPAEAVAPPVPAERRHPLQARRAERPRRQWTVVAEAEPGGAGRRDAAIAERMVELVQELNETMVEAVRNGLIVEPALSRVKNRYGALDDGGYVLSLKLFRKLC